MKTVVRILKKIKHAIMFCVHVSMFCFIHLNFFSSKVDRQKGKYIIPYRGTHFDLGKGAKIAINGNLHLNTGKHSHSNEQTYIRIYSSGMLLVNGEVYIYADSTIEILENAKVSIGQMNSNYNMTLVCSNSITIGNDVELGRNVTIYDSNFHKTSFNNGIHIRPLVIENHVWLCTGVTIAKGLTIKEGAICGINSTVTRNVNNNVMVMGNPAKVTMENVSW